MKKIKSLPKWMQAAGIAFGIGLVAAGILAAFKIDLGTLWRNVMMACCGVLAYIIIYKPFKIK